MSRLVLTCAIALSGCWTFRDLDPVARQNSDLGVDDLGVANDGDSGDTSRRSDLTWRAVDCGRPDTHPELSLMDRPTGALAASIGFVEAERPGFGGQLAWVRDETGYRAGVDIGDFGIAIEVPSEIPEEPAVITDVTIGPADSFGGWVWAATSAPPCVEAFWWGYSGAAVTSTPCSAAATQRFAMEVAGGFNPYTGRGDTSRRIIWHEPGRIVAAGGEFSADETTFGSYPRGRIEQTFTFATRSELTFFGSDATLYAWNHAQARINGENDPEAPVDTEIGFAGAGSFDVVALDPHQYVVARTVGTDLLIERYRALPGSASVTLDGEWYRISGLTRPDGIALATFRGGFALWYAEHGTSASADTEDRWTAQPFRVSDDELTVCESPYVHDHPAITYRDNDLVAFEDGSRLFVVGAVHYEIGSDQYINIEGPFWSLF